MVDPDAWMKTLVSRLRDEFGDRLLFAGLQGSHRRGEAGPASDIDAVVILDRVSYPDTQAYRRIIQSLPQPDLACGFFGGARELKAWPRLELFQFKMDTRAYHGRLEPLLPDISLDDIRQAVAVGASAIVHAVTHLAVHGGESQADQLQPLYKQAFFVIIQLNYLRSGMYVDSKQALAAVSPPDEREIVDLSRRWVPPAAREAARRFTLLLDWSSGILGAVP